MGKMVVFMKESGKHYNLYGIYEVNAVWDGLDSDSVQADDSPFQKTNYI